MYICEECGLVFSEPKKESAESFYGVASLFPDTRGEIVSYCPACGGNYSEAMECPRCNDYISTESSDPFCMDCVNDILSEYAEVIKNNFRPDEYDTIIEHLDDVEPFKGGR